MSGHSKWSTIKHKKAVVDAKRSNVFTKLANGIAVAVREGGSGDPEFNFTLRLAIDKARAANMPKDNIDRAIERGLGKSGGQALDELILEGYGPEGVAVIVQVVTDNRNRSVPEVKTHFDKNGGNLGKPGCVMFMFERVAGKYQATVKMPVTERAKVELFLAELAELDDVLEVYANL